MLYYLFVALLILVLLWMVATTLVICFMVTGWMIDRRRKGALAPHHAPRTSPYRRHLRAVR